MYDYRLSPEDRVIQHQQFRDIKAVIERYMKLSIEVGEPMCVALEGCTGAGKTTLIRTIIHELKQADPSMEIFYMMTPANVTVKGMISGMLQELGDPNFDNSRESTLDARLRRFLRSKGTQLVILDDIQHMVHTTKSRAGGHVEAVSEWLKVFIKDMNIPFVVIAVEDKAELLLKQNEQLDRLFVTKMTLRPFQYGTDAEKTDFYLFVKYFSEKLGVRLDPTLDEEMEEQLVDRIFEVTQGVVNKITKLITIAASLARERGTDIVDQTVLHEAAEMRLFVSRGKDGLRLSSNPFVEDLLKSGADTDKKPQKKCAKPKGQELPPDEGLPDEG